MNLNQMTKSAMLDTLAQCGGNKTQAARLLGIGLKTLYRRLEKAQKGGDTISPPKGANAKEILGSDRKIYWGVYFIQSESGKIKIGYTTDLKLRIREFQNQFPDPIKLIGFIENEEPIMEKALHALFRHHHDHNEWFKPHPEILEYIEKHQTKAEWETRIEFKQEIKAELKCAGLQAYTIRSSP